MSENDERHGTLAGYKAGCRDQCCRTAAAHYQRWREYDQMLGRPRTLPSVGFRRRVEALRAIGWSMNDIGDAIGMDVRNIPAACRRRLIYRSTHQKLAEAYERMCMNPPTDRLVERRKRIAAKRGCIPPLAWDDIDRDERPAQPTGRVRTLDEYRFLMDAGESPSVARRRLGVTAAAIEKAEKREREVA
jgi:hypothetical protein